MKVAIYVRVSTNRQTQAQTIDQQLERLRRHLESRGESLAADHIFRDDGFSGANLNRPGLDRLRDRVKGGVLDRVLLTSPDRLARNYVHQMVLIEEWERCGCKVEFRVLDGRLVGGQLWAAAACFGERRGPSLIAFLNTVLSPGHLPYGSISADLARPASNPLHARTQGLIA